MTDHPAPPPPRSAFGSREDRLFPKLTEEQIARIAPHGRRRPTTRGQVLIDLGDRAVPFFVVASGEIHVLQLTGETETFIVSHGPGSFSGEANLISGRPAMARLRVVEPGEVIEFDREQLLALVQTDAELSEIILRTRTQIIALEGRERLERIRWRDERTGAIETHEIGNVFILAGAIPNTHWLDGCIALDDKGFVKTGPDLSAEELAQAKWPLARPPYLLETSRPRIFAVGDVRGGNVKRVGSAVGEGPIAVAFVHQALRS